MAVYTGKMQAWFDTAFLDRTFTAGQYQWSTYRKWPMGKGMVT